jgi:hypothetical protein
LGQVIGGILIDEHGKFILVGSLPPSFFPFFNVGDDFIGVFVYITPIGIDDGTSNKRNGGKLLGFIDPTDNLGFDLPGNFNRNTFKIDSCGFPQGPLFFKIRKKEGQNKREQTNEHHGQDGLALETEGRDKTFQFGNISSWIVIL